MIQAICIYMKKAEGRTTPLSIVSIEDFANQSSMWQYANNLLGYWAYTCDPQVTCLKTDFRIYYEDGEIYEGLIDLQHPSNAPTETLEQHIRASLLFYLGQRRPAYMTEEMYQNFLKAQTPEFIKEVQDYLETYQIGSE